MFVLVTIFFLSGTGKCICCGGKFPVWELFLIKPWVCVCLLSSSGWSVEHWLYLISICATSGLWASVTFSCPGVWPSLLQLQPLSISGTDRGGTTGIRQPHIFPSAYSNREEQVSPWDLIIWLHVCDSFSHAHIKCFPWSLNCSAQPVIVLSLNFTSWPFCFQFPFHLLIRLILSPSPPRF